MNEVSLLCVGCDSYYCNSYDLGAFLSNDIFIDRTYADDETVAENGLYWFVPWLFFLGRVYTCVV